MTLRAILDIRGLILHAYHSGTDPDASKASDGTKLNTPGFALENFITRYFLPITESIRLNDIIAVKDAGNVYRKALFPEYKAGRQEPLPEVKENLNQAQQIIYEFLDTMGVVQVHVDGVEADDVIGYLVQKLQGSKIIHTVDADLIQLVSEQCLVFQRGEPAPHYCHKYDATIAGVKEKRQNIVTPEFVALYKSLVGDSSDGYVGVKGFGPAKWPELLEAYGEDGLRKIKEDIASGDFPLIRDALKHEPGEHKLLEKLWEQRNEWINSWHLANINPNLVDAFYGTKFQRIKWHKRLPDEQKLRKLLLDTGCSHLISKLQHLTPVKILVDASNYSDMKEDILKAMDESAYVAFDIESSDYVQHEAFNKAKAAQSEYVDMLSHRVAGAGFTFGNNLEYTIYASFDHRDTPNLPKEELVGLLRAAKEKPIVAHNCYFERTVVLNELGFDIPNLHDTKIMASHVDENDWHGLKDLTKSWFDYDQKHYEDVVEKGKRMCDYPATHVFDYGADDPFVTAHLYELSRLILECEGTWDFVRENEFVAVYPLSQSYLDGISVDLEEMARQQEDDRRTLNEAMDKLRKLLEEHRSPEQIGKGAQILFDELSMEVRAKAAKDGKTEDELAAALVQLKADCYEMATYQPLKRLPKPIKALFTSACLSKVAAVLGMPEIPSTSKKAITGYILDNQETGDEKFLRMLGRAAGKKKEDLEVQELLWYAEEILREALPEEERWVLEGSELNLNSPKQNVALLYGMLALPIRLRNLKVSDTRKALGLPGAPGTDKDAVAMAIAEDTKEGDWRREALLALKTVKECLTREGLFYAKYPLWVHPLDGNIHPSVNSTGTDTRRPSGSNPNPFQWPKKGEGVKFRRNVLPNRKKGHDLVVSCDWSSQELRELTGLSQDPELLKVYGPDGDNSMSLHTAVGAAIAKLSYEEFRDTMEDKEHPRSKEFKDLRSKAKNINFGSIYGIGAEKLARQLLCPVIEADEYLRTKKALNWRVEEWRREVIGDLMAKGYVSTLFGSRRHFYNNLLIGNDDLVSRMHRQAVNYKIQGLAADILKRTLKELWVRKILQRYDASLIATIYDEVVVSCHHSVAVPLITELYEIMTIPVEGLGVPLPSAPSLGPNFGDQIEILKEEDVGRCPTPDEIVAAVRKVLETKDLTYWYHDGSNSPIALAANDPEVSLELDSIDFDKYLELLKVA
jgi:DNA polymerase I-like protein with 3'-5' exonuclease and polymerase domains/5'-3' exonuclease